VAHGEGGALPPVARLVRYSVTEVDHDDGSVGMPSAASAPHGAQRRLILLQLAVADAGTTATDRSKARSGRVRGAAAPRRRAFTANRALVTRPSHVLRVVRQTAACGRTTRPSPGTP
jgi:hypothetical protein